MALTQCQECRKEISSAAKTCPNCGAKPRGGSTALRVALCFILVIGLVALCTQRTPLPPRSTAPLSSSTTPPGQEEAYRQLVAQGKKERAEAFAKERPKILAQMKQLVAARKYEAASKLANEYYDVDDAEFQKRLKEADDKASAAVAAAAKREAKKQGVSVGMTPEQVRNSSWGKPDHINRTTSVYGDREQWVYGLGQYLYFERGVLTSISSTH